MVQTTIITAASEKFANALFSFIGSVNCNWPNHPPVIVYDIGLEEKSLAFLQQANIEVRKVPPFCEHWRKHYTWKIWCIDNIETENVIYIDCGLCVMDSLDEIIEEINVKGFFVVPNYQFLDWEASEAACEGCGVEYSFRIGKASIAANLVGFKKKGTGKKLIEEAMSIAMVEKNIMPTHKKHKQDQAILSVLVHKYFNPPVFHDGFVYCGWKSPRMVAGQKVWVHRRGMLKRDMLEYKRRALNPGNAYLPKDPKTDINILEKIERRIVIKAIPIRRRILNAIGKLR